MRNIFLGISVCIGCIAPLVSLKPADASGPYDLHQRGNDISFPTWPAGRSTKLCIQTIKRIDGKNPPGSVTINAGISGREVVSVSPGDTNCIERYWGGVRINVVNSGDAAIKIWSQ